MVVVALTHTNVACICSEANAAFLRTTLARAVAVVVAVAVALAVAIAVAVAAVVAQ